MTRSGCRRPGKVRAWVSWLLLTLVAISVASAPLTQHVWNWDGFLRGGYDFETAMFLILISWCLALVLARMCQGFIERLLDGALVLAALPRDTMNCMRAPRMALGEPDACSAWVLFFPLKI